jgi:hypothetical protein
MGDWSMGPGWGWLFMALLLGGLVLLVVLLVRVLVGGTGGGPVAGGGAGQRRAPADPGRAVRAGGDQHRGISGSAAGIGG